MIKNILFVIFCIALTSNYVSQTIINGHIEDKETGEDFTIIIPQIISHSLFNKVQKVIKSNQKNKGNHVI